MGYSRVLSPLCLLGCGQDCADDLPKSGGKEEESNAGNLTRVQSQSTNRALYYSNSRDKHLPGR
jgi:hypothetical protein